MAIENRWLRDIQGHATPSNTLALERGAAKEQVPGLDAVPPQLGERNLHAFDKRQINGEAAIQIGNIQNWRPCSKLMPPFKNSVIGSKGRNRSKPSHGPVLRFRTFEH